MSMCFLSYSGLGLSCYLLAVTAVVVSRWFVLSNAFASFWLLLLCLCLALFLLHARPRAHPYSPCRSPIRDRAVCCCCGVFSSFMMGQEMGVVAVVDSLAVLREKSIWRQNPADLARPSTPPNFKLAGEQVTCGRWYLGWYLVLLLCLRIRSVFPTS